MSLFYPLFSIVPDFGTDPTHGFAVPHDRIDSSPAKARVLFPAFQPDDIFGHNFTLDTFTEIHALKEFFRARGGRAHPFYLPSWEADLTPITGIAGQVKLTVAGADYAALHLTDTFPDHYGRQIFIWQPGQTLWAERVLSAADAGGNSILDLETPLPFAVDPMTAMVGFCYLSRFSEDQISWRHMLPGLAMADVTFRGIRQHIKESQTNQTSGITIQGSLGFISVTQDAVPVTPPTNRAGYAAGPVNLHSSQDELYSTRWAVWLDAGKVRMKRLPNSFVPNDLWELESPPGVSVPEPWTDGLTYDPGDRVYYRAGIYVAQETTGLPPLTEVDNYVSLPNATGAASALFGETVIATDHLSLAFDQNAWEVIAYQKTAGTIELRQFFNLAVTVRTWAGTDPTLAYNQLIDPNLEDDDSDVVCYYLRPGKNMLYMRIQRDNFGTEYEACPLPLRPLALRRTWAAGLKQRLEILDAGFRSAILITGSYPPLPPPPPPPPEVPIYIGPDLAAGALAQIAGEYTPAVVHADGAPFPDPHPAFFESSGGALAVSGEYVTTVIPVSHGDAGGGALALSGEYGQVVISESHREAGGGALTMAAMAMTLHAISPPSTVEPGGGNLITNLAYEPA